MPCRGTARKLSCDRVCCCLRQFFNKLRASILSAQPSDKRGDMARCFDNLMDGIDRSLLPKNRDKYVNTHSQTPELPTAKCLLSFPNCQHIKTFCLRL